MSHTSLHSDGLAETRHADDAADLGSWLERHRAARAPIGPADYIGSAAAVRAIEGVAAAIRDPARLRAAGGTLPAGIVCGPPGTGKTTLIKVLQALCPTTDAYEVGAAELTGDLVRAIAHELERREKPSIMAIAEIDAIAVDRSVPSDAIGADARGALWALIDVLDPGVRADGGRRVCWIATSSRDPVWLDDALVRRGRLGDLRITLSLPGHATREALVQRLCSRRRVIEPIDAGRIADLTVGATPADVVAVLDDGLRRSLALGFDGLAWAPLLDAVRARDGEVADDAAKLGEAHRLAVITHEASHAVCGRSTGLVPVSQIRAADPHGGITLLGDATEGTLTERELLARATTLIAGTLGERAILGDALVGGQHDVGAATELIAHMVDANGTPGYGVAALSALGPWPGPALADARSAQIQSLFTTCRSHAEAIVNERRAAIERLAQTVLEAGGELAGAELESALQSLDLPKPEMSTARIR